MNHLIHPLPIGWEVLVTKNSGAIYRGILRRYWEEGGGQILLVGVKCMDRNDPSRCIVSPKRGMNRKIWMSKIKDIKVI